jgi:hypothetical protein
VENPAPCCISDLPELGTNPFLGGCYTLSPDKQNFNASNLGVGVRSKRFFFQEVRWQDSVVMGLYIALLSFFGICSLHWSFATTPCPRIASIGDA